MEVGKIVARGAAEKMPLVQKTLQAHVPEPRPLGIFRDVLERIPDAERAACLGAQAKTCLLYTSPSPRD
eukprot:9499968-Alexandrium_andersonii.AAC.1